MIFTIKHESIKSEFKSKNIREAGKKLDLLKMGSEERKHYERYLMHLVSEQGIIETAKTEGREKGIADMAREMKQKGIDLKMISEISGLSPEEIEKL